MPGSYRISIHEYFSSSHYLYNYYDDGSEEEFHSHLWKAEVTVTSAKLVNGMVMDFTGLRHELKKILKDFDQGTINHAPGFGRENPSAENVARFIAEHLQTVLPDSASLFEVKVWEGEDNSASFLPS